MRKTTTITTSTSATEDKDDDEEPDRGSSSFTFHSPPSSSLSSSSSLPVAAASSASKYGSITAIRTKIKEDTNPNYDRYYNLCLIAVTPFGVKFFKSAQSSFQEYLMQNPCFAGGGEDKPQFTATTYGLLLTLISLPVVPLIGGILLDYHSGSGSGSGPTAPTNDPLDEHDNGIEEDDANENNIDPEGTNEEDDKDEDEDEAASLGSSSVRQQQLKRRRSNSNGSFFESLYCNSSRSDDPTLYRRKRSNSSGSIVYESLREATHTVRRSILYQGVRRSTVYQGMLRSIAVHGDNRSSPRTTTRTSLPSQGKRKTRSTATRSAITILVAQDTIDDTKQQQQQPQQHLIVVAEEDHDHDTPGTATGTPASVATEAHQAAAFCWFLCIALWGIILYGLGLDYFHNLPLGFVGAIIFGTGEGCVYVSQTSTLLSVSFSLAFSYEQIHIFPPCSY